MEIYTSYYTKASKVARDTDCIFISISNGTPSWFNGTVHKLNCRVEPSWDIVNDYKNGIISFDEFAGKYISQLRVTKEMVLSSLLDISQKVGSDKVVLLCWEKDASTCHRSVLANWLDTPQYLGEL